MVPNLYLQPLHARGAMCAAGTEARGLTPRSTHSRYLGPNTSQGNLRHYFKLAWCLYTQVWCLWGVGSWFSACILAVQQGCSGPIFDQLSRAAQAMKRVALK